MERFVDELPEVLSLLVYNDVWFAKDLRIHMNFVFEGIYHFLVLARLVLKNLVKFTCLAPSKSTHGSIKPSWAVEI